MDKVEKYIQDLIQSNSAAKRYSAYKLGIIGDMRAFQPLINALQDRNPFVRSNAAEALGNLGNIGAINHLLKYLDDIDFIVRCSVIEAIGTIAKYNKNADKKIFLDAASKLIKLLGDEQYLVRHYSADTLAKIGGDFVKKELIGILSNGNNIEKEYSIWTIGKLEDKDKDECCIELLIEIYQNCNEENIKRAIIKTLYILGLETEDIVKNGITQEEIEELFNENIYNDRLFHEL